MSYQHERHRALKAGRELRGWSQAEMAEKMAQYTGDDGWVETRVTAVENKRRKVSDEEFQAFVEIQGFDVTFYWYGPPLHKQRVGAGDSQRSHHVESVNGHDIAVITKTDEQAAADTFLPRRSFLGGAVKDLQAAPVLSFETPRLELAPEDELWLDLRLQKVG